MESNNQKNKETVALKQTEKKEDLNREGGSTSASKQRYRNRRSAKRILDRWAATPEGQLTPKQRESVAWARETFCCERTERDSVSKRQRSQDEQEAGGSKRAKLQANAMKGGQSITERSSKGEMFSDIVKKHGMILAVIDHGQEDGSITGEKWWKVYDALNTSFLKILKENPGPPPSCRDAGWYQGRAKLTACRDQRSIDLYKLAIKGVGELWPGAKLAAVSREEIPSRPRARVWLPAKPENKSELLEIIRASNPDLPTGNWRIVRQEETKGSFRLSVMVLNKESLAPLARSEGVIGFGFGTVTLKVYKRDEEAATSSQSADLPSEQATADQAVEDITLSDAEGLGMDELFALRSSEEDISEDEMDITVVEMNSATAMPELP